MTDVSGSSRWRVRRHHRFRSRVLAGQDGQDSVLSPFLTGWTGLDRMKRRLWFVFILPMLSILSAFLPFTESLYIRSV